MGATLFLNPADDDGFVRRVNDLVASGVAEPTDLERRLRAWYPNAVVRPRDLANEQSNVWYVYREGHWIPSDLGQLNALEERKRALGPDDEERVSLSAEIAGLGQRLAKATEAEREIASEAAADT